VSQDHSTVGSHAAVVRRAVVAFGANLPWRGSPPAQTICEAARMMAGRSDITAFETSRLWHSTPVNAEGPNFINAVAQFDTSLTAQDLLDWLLSVERAHGRARSEPLSLGPSAARTLDLDLIWMAGISLRTPGLTLPHPRATQRGFVLGPLMDIAPHLELPDEGGRHQTVADWWRALPVDVQLSPLGPMR
jgi:2-amino-4-hydroxy-6-hydroxymethyldihydropteridine diphosphokinase